MNTYLTRPILDFTVEWNSAPEGQFQYDLRDILLGQSAPMTAATASHTVTGYRLKLWMESALNIIAFDAFSDACKGRLSGFWIAAPFAACKILEVKPESIGGTLKFWIEDAKLRDSLTATTYLAFELPGQVTEYARVASCVLDAGRESVTLDAALTLNISTLWKASRLLYARMAADDYTLTFTADNQGTIELSIIELPEEYAAIETGQEPVFLYELGITGLGVWRYTNLNQSITSQSTAFTTWPIAHEGQEQSMDGGQSSLKLKTVFDSRSPVSRLFPYPTPAPFAVKVWETTFAAPNTRTLIFTGFANSASIDGQIISIDCQTVIAALGAQFPRFFIQNRCNYCLFNACCSGTDGPQKADYKVTAIVRAIGGRNVTIDTFSPGTPVYTDSDHYLADYFTFGYIERVSSSLVTSIRTIESNLREYEGSMYLTLTVALDSTWAVGDTVWLYPGCDGTRQTCADKFNNFQRWGGHNIALTNLSVTQIDVPSQEANKK